MTETLTQREPVGEISEKQFEVGWGIVDEQGDLLLMQRGSGDTSTLSHTEGFARALLALCVASPKGLYKY